MKFDVDKFKKDTNYSDRYSDWDSNLQKMNKLLDEKPISEGSKHYWYLNFSRHKWVKIGFDDQGNIFCEYLGRPHKNKKVNVVNEAQIKFITETFLKFLSVFDEFGYILHSANTRIDEREALQMTSDEIKKALGYCEFDNCSGCPLAGIGECYNVAVKEALAYINELEAEKGNLKYTLLGVMHFVDKWLDGNELKQDEVNRADTMRHKTLQIIEEQQAEIDKLNKKVEELSEVLSDSIKIKVKEIKSEAIKEFAEKIKASKDTLFNNIYSGFHFNVIIDSIAKELESEDK